MLNGLIGKEIYICDRTIYLHNLYNLHYETLTPIFQLSTVQVLSHSDEFLLLACDGLFDVFRSQDAIALARQELIAHRGEPAEVARILSDQAIRVRRSRDNVSILIIVLRPFWEL